MGDIRIEGADKVAALAKALKQVGDKELSRELYKALNRSTKPLKEAAKESADARLPRGGGLNRRVAKARMSTRRRGGRNPGVRIVAKGRAAALLDTGRVNHPVFGDRGAWVNGQRVPEARDWFTQPMEEGAPEVRKELVRALDEIARKLARKY